MPSNFQKNTTVLCFNPYKKLLGVFSSYHELERLTGFKHSCVQRACDGSVVSAYGHYWRELPPDMVLESDDLRTMTLVYYDLKILKKDRLVYRTAEMGRGKEVVMVSKIARKFNV